MHSQPLVSVIIPVYNAADFLPYQLEALAAQLNAPPFEVIVADNGSTDHIKKVIDDFQKKLNISLIDASHKKGQSFARNLAVFKASTNYILACDADDVVSPNWVSSLSQYVLDEDCIVTTPLLPFYPHLGESPETAPESRKTREMLLGLNEFPFAQGGSAAYRRSSFIEVGGFDESFRGGSEDIDLSWRITDSGRNLYFCDKACLYYRARENEGNTFLQVYRYARENVLLWKRCKSRGKLINSVSFKIAVIRALAIPYLYIRNRNFEDFANYGGRLGALSGNIKYRLLQKNNSPQLIWDSIPEAKES
ncbi:MULTISPECIES: glycosyltransferase [Rothia]|uniref:glycosyltransferase n=1 Tax=Rothia nasimurium TaxID=85336 RepID=UPI001F3294DA|nr:glycosyltransferase [Rothia nasimurium]